MLTRLYADNFRCLVNFEMKFDRVNLLLGENGTGKTTVFDVLYRLQQFLAGNTKVLGVFPSAELTRWQTNSTQRFELELQLDSSLGNRAAKETYLYSLIVEHDQDRRRAKVKREQLTLDGKKLFDFEEGTAALYHDDFTPGPQYPFDWTQSGVGLLQPRPDNKKLTRFRREIQKIIIAGCQPALMQSETREESSVLARNMENFVSWYRYLSQEHQGSILGIFKALKQVLAGFNACNLKESGEARVMKVLFDRPEAAGRSDALGSSSSSEDESEFGSSGTSGTSGYSRALRPISYDFRELSDGQRVLIAMYSLLHGLKDEGASLFLDEPDNFVALREIQPWLMALTDFTGEGIEQAVLISHHPEIINYLASSGRWFDRDSNSPTRVSDKPLAVAEGLTMAEMIARGWEK